MNENISLWVSHNFGVISNTYFRVVCLYSVEFRLVSLLLLTYLDKRFAAVEDETSVENGATNMERILIHAYDS